MSARFARRLEALSRDALLEICCEAVAVSDVARHCADGVIAKHKPLPVWCVEVMLSPDLLTHIFSSFGLGDLSAASTCAAWATACRNVRSAHCAAAPDYAFSRVHPTPRALLMLPKDVKPYSVAVTPDGSIYVAARSRHLFLMSPHGERRPT
eukprot:3690684-Prymnesium_polylepis.1